MWIHSQQKECYNQVTGSSGNITADDSEASDEHVTKDEQFDNHRIQINGHVIEDGQFEIAASHQSLANDAKDNQTVGRKSAPFLLSQRWIVAYMGIFFGIITGVYRVNISVAVLCMVKQAPTNNTRSIARLTNDSIIITNNNTAYTSIDNTSITVYALTNNTLTIANALTDNANMAMNTTEDTCTESMESSSINFKNAEFTWDKTTQSFVLSSYYYGYMVSQIPGGWVAGRWGGKLVITVTAVVSVVASFLMPLLARFSVYALIASRAVLGLVWGCAVPAYVSLVASWALPFEISRFVSCMLIGQVAGTIIGFSTAGALCVNGFDNGWGSIFYVHGMIGFVFLIMWLFLVYDSPRKHPRITEEEMKLLSDNGKESVSKKEKLVVPWLKMMTCVPLWAIFIVHMGGNCIYYLVLICLPQFLKETMKFDIQSNGALSSLPAISSAASLTLAGILADCLIKRGTISTTATRKCFQLAGLPSAAIFLVICGYINCDKRELVVVILCLSAILEAGGASAGYMCNFIDMAPRYASITFAISNSLGTIPGMLAPLVVAELTPNQTTEEWRNVFFISGGCAVAASIVYGIFGSSELVPWAGETRQELVIQAQEHGKCSPELTQQLLLENHQKDKCLEAQPSNKPDLTVIAGKQIQELLLEAQERDNC